MKFKYYVVYNHSNGYGNAEVICNNVIDTVERIYDIAKDIEQSGVCDVCIINFLLLGTYDDNQN